MSRLMKVFKVWPGEERISLLLMGLMFFTAAGSAVGGNATEALFFARFGVDQLPPMYILLGLFAFGTSLIITALMGRVAKERLYVALPVLLGVVLIGERLVILLNFRWFFAAMWLGMNVISSLQSLMTWGLAGVACDTRQAKRLFPLFSAGGILGTVLGGLVTPLFAGWLHAENLLLIWAGTMFISYLLARALTGNFPAVRAVSHAPRPRIVEEMQRGFQFVRRSPIMQWVSYSAILFSVCFFSLALPFSRGAAAQFTNADELAGFLGLFQSLYTAAALLASLLLANRLYARFGILPMLLVFPVIYLIGFGILTIFSAAVPNVFALLVAFRFAQMAYMNGIAGASWQAMFNVVPPEQRDQVRAFIGGVPEQAGTFIAGLVLFVGEQALQPQQLYLIGLSAAALLVYLIWRASRTYSQALVAALHAGQPQIFLNEEPASGRPMFEAGLNDAWAVSVLQEGFKDPNPSVRRVSAEIFSQFPAPEASEALLHALTDEDPMVKVAALKGLALARAAPALLDVAACLSDPDPDVRFQAIDTLRQLAASSRSIVLHVEPLLADPDPSVRAQAAQALFSTVSHERAREILFDMAEDAAPPVRALALDALGRCQDPEAFHLSVSALKDTNPLSRSAAVRALASINPKQSLPHLVRLLGDNDHTVRSTLAKSLGGIGDVALEPLVNALANPVFEEGALQALGYLPAKKAEQRIREYAKAAAQTALCYHNLALGLAHTYGNLPAEDGRLELLSDSLEDQAARCGLNALRALGLLNAEKREAVAVAVENLRSKSAAQRANALETLETVGEKQLIRPLMVVWEAGENAAVRLPEDWLRNLLNDANPWLRACAVLAAAQFLPDDNLKETLRVISCSDPDETVREAAENLINGEKKMETLPTLSIMERILFLRRVPLFVDLHPSELKQVAAIANEFVFADQETLAAQGDIGDEMYIIISGEVQVLVTSPSQKEPRAIARRRAGDYVGEMAVISQEPRMATLVADGPVRVLCIKQQQFQSIMRERPEISLAMLRILSARLREASQAAVKAE